MDIQSIGASFAYAEEVLFCFQKSAVFFLGTNTLIVHIE